MVAYRSALAGLTFLAGPSLASAAPDFADNDIGFSPIAGILGAYTVTDNSATLTKTKNGNGFTLNYAYTITSVNGRAVDTTWTATRKFDLANAEKLKVVIEGSTKVTQPAGNVVELVVSGTILGQKPEVDFFTNPPLRGALNAQEIKWNEMSAFADVPAKNGYILQMFSGPVWTPKAAGDKISFASSYEVAVTPVPAAAALMASGLAVAGVLRYRARRRSALAA